MDTIYSEKTLLKKAHNLDNLHVHIVDHPLVRHALSVMRNDKTAMADFRSAVHSLTPHLIYAATRDLKEKTVKLQTPLATFNSNQIKDKVVLIPILRSGLGMHGPTQNIFPESPTIFAGMARDEATAIPHWYYDLKELKGLNSGAGAVFLILDPMLATGGSAIETVKRIKSIYPHGKVKMIAMISAPEGVKALNKKYPDVEITTAALDDHLNSIKYIIPGLGDAGDRQFGTI